MSQPASSHREGTSVLLTTSGLVSAAQSICVCARANDRCSAKSATMPRQSEWSEARRCVESIQRVAERGVPGMAGCSRKLGTDESAARFSGVTEGGWECHTLPEGARPSVQLRCSVRYVLRLVLGVRGSFSSRSVPLQVFPTCLVVHSSTSTLHAGLRPHVDYVRRVRRQPRR